MASHFAGGLADVPGAKLAAVGSRSQAHADAFATAFGVERAYSGDDACQALASDPSVSIAYIATPNSLHRQNALTLIEAGKAVLCEKPFAMNAHEAREVASLARERRVFCMEAMWMRFIPAVRDFIERVRKDEVGDPRSATIELGHPFMPDGRHRLFDPLLGGGALLDLGVYAVSLAIALFGPALEVQSQAAIGESGVDEHVTAVLGHGGRRQSLVAASLRTRLSNGASVAGTRGWAVLREPLYRPSALRITSVAPRFLGGGREAAREPARGASMRRALSGLLDVVPPTLRDGGRTVLRPYRGNGYGYEAAEAMRCLREGLLESPRMSLDDTIQVMETLDAIRGRWKVL